MIECAWCGAELTAKRFDNKRGESFCTIYHRTASNAALSRLQSGEYKTLNGIKPIIDETIPVINHG